MMVKISPDKLFMDCRELATMVLDSGFKPDIILTLWRGGALPGVVMDNYFRHANYTHEHFPLKTSHYRADGKRNCVVWVQNLKSLDVDWSKVGKVLIVDDIFDTGKTCSAVESGIYRINSDIEVRIATMYYKPNANLTAIDPDYYVECFDKNDWVEFPFDIVTK